MSSNMKNHYHIKTWSNIVVVQLTNVKNTMDNDKQWTRKYEQQGNLYLQSQRGSLNFWDA